MTDFSYWNSFAKIPGMGARGGGRSQALGYPWGEILRRQSRFPGIQVSPGLGLGTSGQKLLLPKQIQEKVLTGHTTI